MIETLPISVTRHQQNTEAQRHRGKKRNSSLCLGSLSQYAKEKARTWRA